MTYFGLTLRYLGRSSAPFQSTFLPPKLTGLLPSPTELASFWLPLSPEEIASPAFDPYRGPILDTLDLSALTLNLVP